MTAPDLLDAIVLALLAIAAAIITAGSTGRPRTFWLIVFAACFGVALGAVLADLAEDAPPPPPPVHRSVS